MESIFTSSILTDEENVSKYPFLEIFSLKTDWSLLSYFFYYFSFKQYYPSSGDFNNKLDFYLSFELAHLKKYHANIYKEVCEKKYLSEFSERLELFHIEPIKKYLDQCTNLLTNERELLKRIENYKIGVSNLEQDEAITKFSRPYIYAVVRSLNRLTKQLADKSSKLKSTIEINPKEAYLKLSTKVSDKSWDEITKILSTNRYIKKGTHSSTLNNIFKKGNTSKVDWVSMPKAKCFIKKLEAEEIIEISKNNIWNIAQHLITINGDTVTNKQLGGVKKNEYQNAIDKLDLGDIIDILKNN